MSQPQPLHRFLTSAEACEFLRVCPRTLKNWRYDKRIEYVRRGRRVLFRRETLEAFINARIVKAAR
jgi:excisionase family DNA binding protein